MAGDLKLLGPDYGYAASRLGPPELGQQRRRALVDLYSGYREGAGGGGRGQEGAGDEARGTPGAASAGVIVIEPAKAEKMAEGKGEGVFDAPNQRGRGAYGGTIAKTVPLVVSGEA